MRPVVLGIIVCLVLAGVYFALRATAAPPVVTLAPTAPPPPVVVTVAPTIPPTPVPTATPATLVPLKPVVDPVLWVQARVLGGGHCSPANTCDVEVMYRIGARQYISRVVYVGNRYLFGGDQVTMLVSARTGRCVTPCRIF